MNKCECLWVFRGIGSGLSLCTRLFFFFFSRFSRDSHWEFRDVQEATEDLRIPLGIHRFSLRSGVDPCRKNEREIPQIKNLKYKFEDFLWVMEP